MDDRDGAVGGDEERRHRSADNPRAAEHDRLGALQRHLAGTQKQQDPLRRARNKPGLAAPQAPDIDRMKTIDVFRRVDCRNDSFRLDARRQR